jgi:hypothetical protein
MATIFVEGFNHYGEGTDSQAPMLAGRWAQIPTPAICEAPSWGARTDALSFRTGIQDDSGSQASRVALGGSKGVVFVSMGFSVSALPDNDNFYICKPRNGSNDTLAGVRLKSDGTVKLETPQGTLIAQTAAPVIVAQTWHHLEMKFDLTGGTFELRVDGDAVITATGFDYKDDTISHNIVTTMEQLAIGAGEAIGATNCIPYFADLIIRDDSGSRNNDFEGDLSVATLFPNSDTAVAGWTARPRKKFGTGVLDTRADDISSVTAATSASTDIGGGDFTIETFVRFFALPTGSTKAVIFGKWNEAANQRSYQLYKGGDSLEDGNLVFRISTDGQAGTVTELFSWPWAPDLDRWYHVAVSRASDETMLFIDGVQEGVPVSDTAVYFAGTALTVIGGQYETIGVPDTALNGFLDETRLTIGYARYTTTFTPPAAAFGRNVGDDPQFADVALLCGYDSSIADESSYGRTLTARNGAVMNTPDDGVYAFQTINQHAPRDDTFVEAALIPAFSTYTLAANATTTKTVTVGAYTDAGSHPAVYTFKSVLSGAAFEVLIGADADATLANLVAAINTAAGAGTLYGTGTIVNDDVTATILPLQQMLVTANIAGTAGNSIACTTNDPNGSWTDTTLDGGEDIPGPSEFSFERPPALVTVIKSVTMVSRSFKSESGPASVQVSFIGPLGGATAGADNALSTSARYYSDTFETDPDTAGDLSPTTIVGSRVKLDRTE